MENRNDRFFSDDVLRKKIGESLKRIVVTSNKEYLTENELRKMVCESVGIPFIPVYGGDERGIYLGPDISVSETPKE